MVLDEAYPCTEQEMSLWKGRNSPPEKDAFNYYLLLNRQVIECAFGILVQRWGIFWCPLQMSMDNRGVVVHVTFKLHNICIDNFGMRKPDTLHRGFVSDFSQESDYQVDDWLVPQYTDGLQLYHKVTGQTLRDAIIEMNGLD